MYHLGIEYLCTVSSMVVDATVKELHYQAFISGKCMVTARDVFSLPSCFAEFRHTASVETCNTVTVVLTVTGLSGEGRHGVGG